MNEETDSEGEEWRLPLEDRDKSDVGDMCTSSNTVCVEGLRKTQEQCTSACSAEHARVIIHIDVDCFYAQVEMLRNPELRDKPLGIQQKYIVVTCNYKAREYGVTKLMTLKDAKEKCPQLVLVSGEDLTNYREISYKISEFLLKYTPLVERLGFDENFLDVSTLVDQRIQANDFTDTVIGHVFTPKISSSDATDVASCFCGCRQRIMVGSQVADDIRQALYEELGITSCAGISYNKLLAKLVGECHKPNQQTTLFPHFVQNLMTSLGKVRKIPGIGSAMMKRLEALGIYTVTDLQNYPLTDLQSELGNSQAVHINKLSKGIDQDLVHTYGKPQTISDEDSYNYKKCCTVNDAQVKIRSLLVNLIKRIQEDGRLAGTMRVTICRIVDNKFRNRESKQCPLPPSLMGKILSNTDAAVQRLEILAMSLLQKIVDFSKPFQIALMNIAFCNLHEKPKNSISLFFSPKKMSPEKPRQNDDSVRKDLSRINTQQNDDSVCKDLSRMNTQTKVRFVISPQDTSEKKTVHPCCLDNTDNHHCALECGSGMKRKAEQIQKLFQKRTKQSSDIQECGSHDRQNQSSHSTKVCKDTFDTHSVCQRNRSPERSNSQVSPDEIDLSVLAELPINIRSEILSQLTAEQRANLKSQAVETFTVSTSESSNNDIKIANTNCMNESLLSHQKGELIPKGVFEGCVEQKSVRKPKESMEFHNQYTVSQNKEDEPSCNHRKYSEGQNSQCEPIPPSTSLPSNIDQDVFHSLPSDIQREVLNDHHGILTLKGCRSQTKGKVRGKAAKKTVKKTTTDGNILKFFNKNA